MEQAREVPCEAPQLPEAIVGVLEAASAAFEWARSTVGQSGGDVWRVASRDGRFSYYLKRGTGDAAKALQEEADRLRWLARHVSVPQLVAFAQDTAASWLLMTAIPGKTAWDVLHAEPGQRARLIEAIAAHLRIWHAIPPPDCPFSAVASQRLAAARVRIDAGLVDEDDFDDERAGWSAAQVWDALMASPLPGAPPVVTHGDFSLDNILIENGAVTGCIDVGRAGLADRYQDIAILWNCLGEFGPELQSRLLVALGEGAGDRTRLDFHLLLDELF